MKHIILMFVLIQWQNIFAQDCQFIYANQDDNFEPTKYWFGHDSSKFIINVNGKGLITLRNGKKVDFSIPVPEGYFIVGPRYSDCVGDILIVYGVTDNNYGSGAVVRLDKSTMKTKWSSEIWGFNIGDPFYHNQYLYLTSIGWVGKLNVLTGKYQWQIDDLYRSPGIYNSFDKPYFPKSNDSVISFPEGTSGMGGKRTLPLQILEVDNYTGKILSGGSP